MQHEYEVISCENVSPSTAVYTLRNTDPTRPLAYQPGQYASISFLKNGRATPARCFSIASSPTEQHVLQFAMRVKGHYTTSVTKHVKPGDIINVGGPYGGFIFNVVRDQAAVFLAGGIGIAPFMSMVRYASRLKLENDIILFYSCRSSDDVAFADELMHLEKINPHLHVIFVIGEGPLHRFAGHRAVNGMLNDEMVNQVLAGRYDPYSFFICGPPPFMDAMQKALLARGVHRKDIRTEVFGQSSEKLNRGLSWPARVYGATAASIMLLPGLVLANDIVNPITETQKKAKAAEVAAEKNETMSNHEHAIAEEMESTEVNGEPTTDTSDTTTTDSSSTSSSPSKSSTSTSKSSTTGGSTKSSSGSSTTTPTKKAPTVTLSASATSMMAGGSVTLSWSATDTANGRCTASGGWGGAKNASGSETVRPAVTTTYTILCSNEVGSQSKSVTITVTAAPVKPSVTLTASSTNVAAGTAITLGWDASGTGPLNCTASGGWTGTRAASGNTSVTPTTTTTYTLACSNSAGSDSKSVTVTVGTPATTSLSASSTTIMEGDSTTLNWSSAGTGPVTCSASGGWSGTKAASGSASVAPTATTTYTLRCSNAYGAQTRSITITVEPHTSTS